jgi:spore germination cell wall hydrolase CwlJ-like protein|tara:strand:- start:1059 stop:1610 length:552 start_codon:yes stop_codon:yes gene_type:complete
MKSIYKTTIAVAINTAVFAAVLYTGNTAHARQEAEVAQHIATTVKNEMYEMQEAELECLALNIYFETHAASLIDAMSVSDVVLNRVNSKRYPDTVCDVVQDGYKKGRKTCQFSWYCDGKTDVPMDNDSWEKSRKHARDMYVHGAYRGVTEGATHYHAHYMRAYWASSLNRVARMGQHIFYREK